MTDWPDDDPRLGFARQQASFDAEALRRGVMSRPLVIFCHIRGEAEPFPSRWHLGQLSLGQGMPVWRSIRSWRGSEGICLPAGTTINQPPRQLLRSELSAFSPNPRKSVVLPLDSNAGQILVAVRRLHIHTLLAALRPLDPEAS
jgi:hypothetical protein